MVASPTFFDRVLETSSSTGTGAFTLLGAKVGYRAFKDALAASGDPTFYCIAHQSASEWEVGVGTVAFSSLPAVLTRSKVLQSSNSGSATSFSTGTKDVFLCLPSAIADVDNRTCEGRLTLEQTTGGGTTPHPAPTTDQTAKTTVYFTPYLGNRITLWNGYCWQSYTFSEVSIALGTLTSGKNYDVFAYDSGGVVTLKIGPAWSTDTARGTGAGTTQVEVFEGVYVNTVAISSGPAAQCGRLLGTFRTTSTTTTEDSKLFRGLSNLYNQLQRQLLVTETTDSWTSTDTNWHSFNSDDTNRVEIVQCIERAPVRIMATSAARNSSVSQQQGVGIGLDSTSANSANVMQNNSNPVAGAGTQPAQAFYEDWPGQGYHYFQMLEKAAASGTSTFFGDAAGTVMLAGMLGSVWG